VVVTASSLWACAVRGSIVNRRKLAPAVREKRYRLRVHGMGKERGAVQVKDEECTAPFSLCVTVSGGALTDSESDRKESDGGSVPVVG
jgi:hypothetical protein